ncbi:MAG: enoyl-ACP reductase [Bacillota bacterium]|nr:enoyl-ACP reductase [Bacillota bacterium]MDW7728966.1 enoyl-ACP reductase [Bacillota bacterium]
MAEQLLEGKNVLVMGVANKRSIAWAIAVSLKKAGANLAFTYQSERFKDKVGKMAEDLEPGAPLIQCDVGNDAEIDELAKFLGNNWTRLDGLVHSLAFAKKEELTGMFVHTSREGFLLAQEISAYSLVAVTKRLYPMFSEGGSIITLTFMGSQRVVTNYNVMGVAKASLEASVRYLANDLGPLGIRVNAVSAGPIRTVSAKGVSDFNRMLDGMEQKNPLRRLVPAEEVAGSALFLLSDLSTAVTGNVIFADGGYHIMGV